MVDEDCDQGEDTECWFVCEAQEAWENWTENWCQQVCKGAEEVDSIPPTHYPTASPPTRAPTRAPTTYPTASPPTQSPTAFTAESYGGSYYGSYLLGSYGGSFGSYGGSYGGSADAPAVVEIAFVVSFAEEVGLIDEIRACNALVTEIATLAMIDEDYFECGMTLSDGSTRHLLSFVYNTEIVITIPATDLATSEGDMMVEGLQATVADTGTLTDVLNTSLETALPNNVGAVTSKIDVVVELPYSTTETDSSTQSPTAFTYTNCRDCSIQRRGNLRKLSFGRVPCCITQI